MSDPDVWDVVVAGAGPAGSVVAALTASAGLRVLLADRATFPRSKVCGCCLNGRAAAALADASLGDVLRPAVPLRRMRLAGRGASATIPLPRSYSLSRTRFDADLIAAAVSRGAHFSPATTVRVEDGGESSRTVRLRRASGDTTVAARVVVLATGLASGPADASTISPGSRIGLGATFASREDAYPPGELTMCVGESGYVGLVRLEDGTLDVAAAVDPAAVKDGAAALLSTYLAAAGLPVPDGLASATFRGTPPLTRAATTVAERRLFRVGDAAGYVEPFTGEGMAWAISSAVALAPLVTAAARSYDDSHPATWKRLLRRVVGRRQWPCKVASVLLRRPRLASAVTRSLRLLPQLASPVVSYLDSPSRAPGATL